MNDVCTGCGEPNPPGTQFCLFCGIYLGWDDPGEGGGEPTGPLLDPPTAPLPESPPDQADAAAPAAGAASTSAPVTPAPVTAAPPTATAALAGPDPGPPVATAAPIVPHGPVCPSCGRDVVAGRRFCGHCGQVLAHGAPVRAPAPRRRRWWQRLLRSDTRVARRAYRRSLPPLYRWRRVGIVVLLVGLVGGAFAVIGRDPIGWGTDRWYDLTDKLEAVTDVTVRAEPEDAVVGDHVATGLIDHNPETAWVTEWEPPEEPARCGAAPGGRVVLSFPETRVRGLRVITGVTDPSTRPLQQIPTQLHVMLPDGTCRTVDLDRSPEVQDVAFDSQVPVSRLTISIGATFRSDDDRVEDVAGLSELGLVARPAH